MEKIAIIGCPGSGKTTFAVRLAQRTRLPLFHLDKHYHDQAHDFANDTEAWRTQVQELVAQPRWICDGNYKSTFDIRLGAADTIIFLDYPRRLVLWRAFKRRVSYRKTLRPDMPKGWKEKVDWPFFLFMVRYRRQQRPAVLELLKSHQDKQVLIFHRPAQAALFLDQLSS